MVYHSGERLIEESTMNATAFGLTTSIASAQLLALPAWELPDAVMYDFAIDFENGTMLKLSMRVTVLPLNAITICKERD
jgi:hypothetical protein